MTIKDLFRESYSALAINKVRSGLTMLGIVIGIGSVISLVAIGQGAQGSIQANIQSIGSNLIIVTPGAPRGPGAFVSAGRGSAQTLTMDDEAAVAQQISSAKAVDPELSRRFQVTAVGTNTNTQVVGTDDNYQTVRNVNIDLGSFITAQNVSSLAKVAVLGPTTRDDLFGPGADPTGQTIKINAISFKIIGVTQSKGGSGFLNQDDIIFIPISTAQHYLVGPNASGKAYVTDISISATDQSAMPAVQQQVTDLLLARHNISDASQADFTVQNQADIVATASSVTNTFTLLLASIAGISLLVGGIGIMNMMLTTVTERTREIGLRKAIGATRQDINFQFLTEAVMLTFMGGIIGIFLGWLVSFAATKFAGLATQISISSILLAFGVSAGIGVVFGYYPALRASKLNPIEALRFE
jgi:putative ABC transport system permease protein